MDAGAAVELEFRDGKRVVSPYIARLLSGIETHRFLYEEAIDEANRRAESAFIRSQQDAILAVHFRENR